jgi:hypothetical protein
MGAEPPIFQYNPAMAPDSDYEPGALYHLVVGNRARRLDDRRTPVRVVALRPETGMFEVELLDFEDKGARWSHPLEEVAKYQFAIGSRRARETDVNGYREAVARFDRPLVIECDPARAEATRRKLAALRGDAARWLEKNSRFLASGEPLQTDESAGSDLLFDDLRDYMAHHHLDDMETDFARQWASNAESGERIKGHRIVVAELSLSPFTGKIVRDPALFDGPWNKPRRAEHVLHRMAFVQALFARRGVDRPVIYRTVSCQGPLQPRTAHRAFISGTFSRRVAEALFGRDPSRTVALFRQSVPLERLFMTYLETAALNHPFREAEAVLIADPTNLAF